MPDAIRRASRGLSLVVAVMSLLLNAPTASGQGVLINEVFTGNPDYVELTNFGGTSVDVSGWVLHSSFGFSVYPAYTIPAGTSIDPGASLLLLELNATLPTTFNPPEANSTTLHTGFSWGWVGNSSGCVILVDTTGAGRDLLVFGTTPCTVPGSGFGTTFNGVIDRSQNDFANDNVIQRVSSIDTDIASDWAQGPNTLATPGNLNPTQSTGPIAVERLVLSGNGAAFTFHDDGTFDVGGTISGVVTTTGALIENPIWDPVVGGTISFSGTYSTGSNGGTDPYANMVLAPASLTIASSAPGTDELSVLNLFQFQSPVQTELGGAHGATPRRFRKLSSLALNAPQRSGQTSLVLSGLQAGLPTGSLDFDVEMTSGGLRLLAVGQNLSPRPTDWQAQFAVAGPGQVEVGVINAGPAELYHVFVVNPGYAIGTGPVAGIDFGPQQFDMVVMPLGTDPFHVAPAADGSYHFLSPPGIIPPGWVLDFLPVRLQSGVVETLAPQRAQF